jgi:ATP-binding cassette subfamily C protein
MLPQWFLQRGGAAVGTAGDLVTHEGAIWIVQHGSIDVFLVPAGAGVSDGAREHLVSVISGQMFVFPQMSTATTHTLFAAIGPNTQFLTMQRREFAAMLDDDDGIALLLPMIDSFFCALPRLTPPPNLPISEFASENRIISSDENRKTIASQVDGLWAHLKQGHATYGGNQTLPRLMPLPSNAWIDLEPESVVSCLSTLQVAEFFNGSEILVAIEDSVRAALSAADDARQKRELDELDRLERKSELGRQAMADALGNLASLFDSSGQKLSVSEDALLGACRLIGKTIDVTFKASANAAASGAKRDPVKDIAEASGIRTRIVALKGEWWHKDNGPLLVFSEKARDPIALLPLKSGVYQAVSPTTGETIRVDAVRASEFAKFGYMFYRGLPKRILHARDMLKFATQGIRFEMLGIAGISMTAALLAMAIPVASGYLFDDIFPAANHTQMLQVVAMLFLASIVNLLLEATRSLLLLRIEGKASSDLQTAVWDRVLNLPIPFFRQYAAGDLATRINGINDIRQALSGAVMSSIVNAVFSLFNVFLMLHYSAKLTAIALILVAVAMMFNMVIAYFRVRVTAATTELNGAVAGRILEYLGGITKLRVTGSEARAFANWSVDFANQKRLSMRAGVLANISQVFGVVFPLISNVAIFSFIASVAFDRNDVHFSTGDFIAFSVVFTLFLNAMLGLVRTGMTVVDVMPMYQRTKPILETAPEVDEHKDDPGILDGAIELTNINFSYSVDTALILNDVSLRIEPGEFVALVGASGSGKSTLLRLMLGFEKPSQGDIYYDKHNIRDIDIGALRRQLGVVLQSGRIMSGDIFKNIIGSTSLLLSDAWDAARACGLDKDIESMPMQMHTIVSDGGGTLSGGQRQRLLIARAIVHKPRIIFFDEATSALDNQTQAIVSASMEKLNATRIVIAHRLSTIINADRIYVLDKGRVVQSGTYSELMQHEGLFAELAKRQIA